MDFQLHESETKAITALWNMYEVALKDTENYFVMLLILFNQQISYINKFG